MLTKHCRGSTAVRQPRNLAPGLSSDPATLVDAGHSRPYINKLMRSSPGPSSGPRPRNWCRPASTTPFARSKDCGRDHQRREPFRHAVEDTLVRPRCRTCRGGRDMVRFQRLTGPGRGGLPVAALTWTHRRGLAVPTGKSQDGVPRSRADHLHRPRPAVILPYLLREENAYCFSPAESEAKRHDEMRARRKTKVQPSQQNRGSIAGPSAQGAVHQGRLRPRTPAGDRQGQSADHQAGCRAGITIRSCSPIGIPISCGTPVLLRLGGNTGLEAAQVILGHAKADVTRCTRGGTTPWQ